MCLIMRIFMTGVGLFYLFTADAVSAQDSESSKLGLVLGVASWFNNCDIPSGGQDTGIHPSFGPNIQITYGNFFVSWTFFLGNFKAEPDDGIRRVGPNFEFTDTEARNRGFTSQGETERLDLTLNLGYAFERHAILSFSFVVNRHQVNLDTYWFPTPAANGDSVLVALPSQRQVPFQYTDTQFWFGQNFGGSIPVETVSTNFSIFYNIGLLVILGESGNSRIGNDEFPVPRLSYTNDNGDIVPPGDARGLPNRPFGENVGISFNLGAGFQLFPAIGIYGGYNFKFFAEDETDFIDHSRFHGPFLGFSWTVK